MQLTAALALAAAACAAPLAVQAENSLVDIGTLGGSRVVAAVSAAGSVVVGSSVTSYASSKRYAFRWTSGGGMANLGSLGGSISWASGVSADGSVVVGTSTIATEGPRLLRAFRWSGSSGLVDLGTLGGDYSSAVALSADGAVVVGESLFANDRPIRAFRWTSSGGMADLGSLGVAGH